MCAVIYLDAASERGYRLARHGLVADGEANLSMEGLAGSMFGLHAARQSSPWVALRARLPGFEASDLRSGLRHDRRLIKVRCMRQTLHILPVELAPTAHHATLQQRLGPCRARLRTLGCSERALNLALERVRTAVGDEAVPYRQLEAAASGRRLNKILVRLAIKWLWEIGEFAHVDLSPSLHHEHRAFARTRGLHPQLDLAGEEPHVERARDALVAHHIRAFGPTSIRDTAWWSGLGITAVKRAVARSRNTLVTVRVEGINEDLLLAEEESGGCPPSARPRERPYLSARL